MIRHTVLYRWKPEATEEDRQQVATEVAKLPSMVPSIRSFASGQDAGLAWESLLRGDCDEREREWKRKALLSYCCQDTLGMVKLVELLRERTLEDRDG